MKLRASFKETSKRSAKVKASVINDRILETFSCVSALESLPDSSSVVFSSLFYILLQDFDALLELPADSVVEEIIPVVLPVALSAHLRTPRAHRFPERDTGR